jgi:predicted kinase
MSVRIELPADALVVLIGIAGSGKSTLAARHFAPTQILSSDRMRALIADNERDQSVTDEAFALLHTILELRLARARLTVVDATNVEAFARASLLDLAWRFRRPAVAIVLDLDPGIAASRNSSRPDGPRPAPALRRQQRWLRETLPVLESEGFGAIHVLRTPEDVETLEVVVPS